MGAMRKSILMLLLAVVSLFLAGCAEKGIPDSPDSEVFTLYSNAPSDEAYRISVATFDSHRTFSESNEFINQKYCNEAAAMFQAKWEQEMAKMTDPGVRKVRHWCEKGRFKK